MTLVSMMTYPAFLLGIFVLFAVKSMADSTPETNNITSTVEPSKTTRQLTTVFGFHNKMHTQPAAWESSHQPAVITVSAAPQSTVVTTVESKEAFVSDKTNSSNDSTVGLVIASTATAAAAEAAPTSSAASRHTSTAVGETQPSHHTTIKETAEHTEGHSHQQSATTSTDMTALATASATFPSRGAGASPQPTSITESEITSELSSTFSSEKSAVVPVIQNFTSPSASTTAAVTTEPVSETTHALRTTFLAPTTAEASKTSAEISSTSQSISASSPLISTSSFPDTTESNSTSISTESPNSPNATVILIPRRPTLSPVPTTISAQVTKSPQSQTGVPKVPVSTEVQPCSTQSVVKQCLVVIACLAVVATIFIFSTIVLCSKLSVRKRKHKPQQATEMMCISTLLPERPYNYTRQHNRVPNGVLVIPRGEDSDDEVGDNLTLSSFLPDNDRYV